MLHVGQQAVARQMATANAGAPQSSQFERALYGALCGYLPAVLPVCTTWEDALWAYARCNVEARVTAQLQQRKPNASQVLGPKVVPTVLSFEVCGSIC